jgi:hypothetical protein
VSLHCITWSLMCEDNVYRTILYGCRVVGNFLQNYFLHRRLTLFFKSKQSFDRHSDEMDSTIVAKYLSSRKEKIELTDSETLLEESDSCGDTVSHQIIAMLRPNDSQCRSIAHSNLALVPSTPTSIHIGTNRQSK